MSGFRLRIAILWLRSTVIYLGSLAILIYTFGWKHGLLTWIAMILFGWGMNLENRGI